MYLPPANLDLSRESAFPMPFLSVRCQGQRARPPGLSWPAASCLPSVSSVTSDREHLLGVIGMP